MYYIWITYGAGLFLLLSDLFSDLSPENNLGLEPNIHIMGSIIILLFAPITIPLLLYCYIYYYLYKGVHENKE